MPGAVEVVLLGAAQRRSPRRRRRAAPRRSARGAGPARLSTRAHSPATWPHGGIATVATAGRLDAPRSTGSRRRRPGCRCATRAPRRARPRDPRPGGGSTSAMRPTTRSHDATSSRWIALTPSAPVATACASGAAMTVGSSSSASSRSPAPGPRWSATVVVPGVAGDARDPARAPAVAKEAAHGVGELGAGEKRPALRLGRDRRTSPRTPRRSPARTARSSGPAGASPAKPATERLERGDPALGQRKRADGGDRVPQGCRRRACRPFSGRARPAVHARSCARPSLVGVGARRCDRAVQAARARRGAARARDARRRRRAPGRRRRRSRSPRRPRPAPRRGPRRRDARGALRARRRAPRPRRPRARRARRRRAARPVARARRRRSRSSPRGPRPAPRLRARVGRLLAGPGVSVADVLVVLGPRRAPARPRRRAPRRGPPDGTRARRPSARARRPARGDADRRARSTIRAPAGCCAASSRRRCRSAAREAIERLAELLGVSGARRPPIAVHGPDAHARVCNAAGRGAAVRRRRRAARRGAGARRGARRDARGSRARRRPLRRSRARRPRRAARSARAAARASCCASTGADELSVLEHVPVAAVAVALPVGDPSAPRCGRPRSAAPTCRGDVSAAHRLPLARIAEGARLAVAAALAARAREDRARGHRARRARGVGVEPRRPRDHDDRRASAGRTSSCPSARSCCCAR